MEYYNRTDRVARRYAVVITLLLLLLLAYLLSSVVFEVDLIKRESQPLEIILEELVEEPEVQVDPVKVTIKRKRKE
jgi:hypothetical protein